MKTHIDEIIRELVAIDPSFAAHEKELRGLITELLDKKPDTRLDPAFVARLREKLLHQKSVPSPFSALSYAPYVLGVLAVLLVVPIGYYATQNSGVPAGEMFAMHQEIERLPSGAFGPLGDEGGRSRLGGIGMGDEGATMSVASDLAAPAPAVAMNAAEEAKMSANMAYGMGGGSDRMIYPAGPVTVTTYAYTGEPLSLEESGAVYSRTKTSVSSAQIASQLKKFNFGVVNLNGFSDMRVRSFELVEDKPYGYSVMASFDDGMISINPNYLRWPGLDGKEMQQIPMSAMPKDSEVTAIAERFLADHDISTVNFGEPQIQQYAEPGIAETGLAYAPEQVTVTYPLKISGTTVYEEGAYPYGLQVGVGVRDKRVMSVYGLTAQTYSSSDYTLETSADKVLSVVQRGGSLKHAWIPQEGDGITVKRAEAEVGTPEKVLLHTYNYSNSESKELFVPALSFPVTKAPADGEYYPKYIVVPLVPELLDAKNEAVLYDMVR